jgi:predicted metal-dependent phosphoesterase TrpH
MLKLYGDLHIHSIVSDGALHPSEIVKISKLKSINVISVTDHNTFLGSVIASRYVDKRSQILIYGAEVKTYLGEVLLLCPQAIRISYDLSTLVDSCRENNCLLVPSHPYDILRLGIKWGVNLKVWDAVEIFNSSSDPISNIITYILARGLNIPLLANSDAHVGELIGSAFNIIYADGFTVDDVLESIRVGNVTPVMRYSLLGSIYRFSWSLKRTVHGLRKTNLMYDLVSLV